MKFVLLTLLIPTIISAKKIRGEVEGIVVRGDKDHVWDQKAECIPTKPVQRDLRMVCQFQARGYQAHHHN